MLRLIIFDLDGTILENEVVYGEAFKKVLESLGAKDLPRCPQIGGIGLRANWPKLIRRYGLKTDKSVDELCELTQEFYLKYLHKAKVKAGFNEFARQVKRANIKTALATSNNKKMTNFVLKTFSLKRYFDVRVTADDVMATKPSPEMFIKAAKLLRVPSRSTLVFEDAKAGVDAAHGAGMKVVGVRNKDLKRHLKEAELVINDFTEINLEKVEELYK